jgi:hypothetical protein
MAFGWLCQEKSGGQLGQCPRRLLQIECLLFVPTAYCFSPASVTAIGVEPPVDRSLATGSSWDKGVKEIVRDVDQETTSLGQTRVDGRSVAT